MLAVETAPLSLTAALNMCLDEHNKVCEAFADSHNLSSMAQDRLKLLLVQPDAKQAKSALRALEAAGLEFTQKTVSNRETFLAELASPTEWSVVVASSHVADLELTQLIEDKRAVGLSSPVVLFDSELTYSQIQSAFQAGVSDYVLLDDAGRLPFVVVRVQREEAQRRAAEKSAQLVRQALQQALITQGTYQTLFDNNPQPAWVVRDETLRFLKVNQASVDFYGYSEEEFLSMTLWDVRNEAEFPKLKEALAGHVRDFDGLAKHRKKDGTEIEVQIRASHIQVQEAGCRLVAITDMSEHLRHQREIEASRDNLRRSESRFRALFDSNVCGVYRSDLNGKIVDANSAFAKMYGYDSIEELKQVNKKLLYLSENDREDLLSSLLREGLVFNREISAIGKNGIHLTVLTNMTLVVEEAGISILGVEFDVTQLRNLEMQNRQLQKMEALGQLAGGIAHDFNNILMILRSYTELGLGQPDLEKRNNYLAKSLEALHRGGQIVQQMLLFSRKQDLQVCIVDLNELVLRVLSLYRSALGEKISISFQPWRESLVKADPAQLEQVILNLLVNARDAMSDGGRIGISLKPQEAAPGTDVELVALAVSDSGPGMPREVADRVFEPFFSTKGQGKGTGLGLSAVHGVVGSLGGSVKVESELGKGSRFTVLLPSATKQELISEPEQLVLTGGAGQEILIVEDELDLQQALSDYLTQLGYHALCARNAKEALAYLRKQGTKIRAIVSDVVMPGIDGPEMALQAKSECPHLRFVFMSGYMPDPKSQSIIENLPGVFLRKPFPLSALSHALAKALLSKKPRILSPSV